MINLYTLNRYRITHPDDLAAFGGWAGDHSCGAFYIPSPIDGKILKVVASNGDEWDHVSVSRKNRCPNWNEMNFIFHLFFLPTETAYQLHVPSSEHINYHPYCLHLWRPHTQPIPKPPPIFVGPQPSSPKEADSVAYKSSGSHSPDSISSPPATLQSELPSPETTEPLPETQSSPAPA